MQLVFVIANTTSQFVDVLKDYVYMKVTDLEENFRGTILIKEQANSSAVKK